VNFSHEHKQKFALAFQESPFPKDRWKLAAVFWGKKKVKEKKIEEMIWKG